MSLLKKIGRVLKPIAKIAAPFIPGVGGLIAGAIGSRPAAPRAAALPPPSFPALPRIPTTAAALPMLPSIISAGRAVIPAVTRVLPGIGSVASGAAGAIGRVARMPGVRKWSRRAIAAVGGYTIGSSVFDAAGNLIGQRSRRTMNMLNGKAAKRAIRRVKGARKMLMDIERQLPRQKARGNCAPPFARKKKC